MTEKISFSVKSTCCQPPQTTPLFVLTQHPGPHEPGTSSRCCRPPKRYEEHQQGTGAHTAPKTRTNAQHTAQRGVGSRLQAPKERRLACTKPRHQRISAASSPVPLRCPPLDFGGHEPNDISLPSPHSLCAPSSLSISELLFLSIPLFPPGIMNGSLKRQVGSGAGADVLGKSTSKTYPSSASSSNRGRRSPAPEVSRHATKLWETCG